MMLKLAVQNEWSEKKEEMKRKFFEQLHREYMKDANEKYNVASSSLSPSLSFEEVFGTTEDDSSSVRTEVAGNVDNVLKLFTAQKVQSQRFSQNKFGNGENKPAVAIGQLEDDREWRQYLSDKQRKMRDETLQLSDQEQFNRAHGLEGGG